MILLKTGIQKGGFLSLWQPIFGNPAKKISGQLFQQISPLWKYQDSYSLGEMLRIAERTPPSSAQL
jgi:hypothetical protein